MAIRRGNREQMQFLPASIEEYVSVDAPVRVYDAFADALDFGDLGIRTDNDREGNPSYDPRSMMKLLLYGYSYGIRSSRKLEREVHYNLSFIWLMGGLKPDHKTIAEFRRKNKAAIQRAMVQCVRLCLKLGLIDGNILFTDGTKMRGNAALKNSWNEKKVKRVLLKAEERIEEILKEAEDLDAIEKGAPSLVSLPARLSEPEATREKVERILKELKGSGKTSLNTTDKECASFNGIHGAGAGYIGEVVVDDKHGLIASADVVSASNDIGQLSGQIEQAQEILGHAPVVAVADAGFSDLADLKRLDEQGIKVIVPNPQIASGKKIGEFDKRKFSYLSDRDRYVCPEGHELKFVQVLPRSKSRLYTIENKSICLNCVHYGKCTNSKSGRKLERCAEEVLKIKLEAAYAMPENRLIYKRRQAKNELVFGHFRKNLGMDSFLLRGIAGARAEIGILAVCFNLRRMITLLGQGRLTGILKPGPL
jgi:transposase